jgi:Protein of unknown function (DUF1156)
MPLPGSQQDREHVTKKLIEVALPLDAINAASARESYIYRGNPSAIHKWWAQRPPGGGASGDLRPDGGRPFGAPRSLPD